MATAHVDPETAAMAVFNDMVAGGCSLKDAVVAAYLRGRADAGEPPAKVEKRPAVPPCPYEAIVGLYNDILSPPLPAVRSIEADRMNKDRRTAIRKAWEWVLTSNLPEGQRRAVDAAQALDWFHAYFTRAKESDWIMGRDPASRGWKGDIDYLMTAAGIRRVREKT